jgi:hypothetical protein
LASETDSRTASEPRAVVHQVPSSPVGEGPSSLIDLTAEPERLGRAFWAVTGATGVTGIGDGMALVALPLLAAVVAGSPGAVAGVVVAQRLPWLLLALPAGVVADRADRLSVMARMDLVRGAIVGALAAVVALGHPGIAVIYGAALAVGCADTFSQAASRAVIPEVARGSGLIRANSWFTVAETGSEQFIGPALGGAAFAAGASVPLIGDALSFLGSASLVRVARAARGPAPGKGLSLESPDTPVSCPSSARAGLRASYGEARMALAWFWSQPLLRVLALTIGMLAFFQAASMATLVLFGLRVLHLSKPGYGLLLSVSAVGNVAGALVAPRFKGSLSGTPVLCIAGVVAAGAYATLASTSSAFVAAVALTVEAVAVACGNVATQTLRQTLIPNHLLGRVGTVFQLLIRGGLLGGAVAGGALAAIGGLRAPLVVSAVGQAVAVAAVSLPLLHRGRQRGGVPRVVVTPTPEPSLAS